MQKGRRRAPLLPESMRTVYLQFSQPGNVELGPV